jgi:hypothetical protein
MFTATVNGTAVPLICSEGCTKVTAETDCSAAVMSCGRSTLTVVKDTISPGANDGNACVRWMVPSDHSMRSRSSGVFVTSLPPNPCQYVLSRASFGFSVLT